MSRPWMPLYIGDYKRDTQHLTTLQNGAYLLLIMEYWTKGGFEKNSQNFEKYLQKISGLSSYMWQRNKFALHCMFTPDWRHPRIDKELEKARQITLKRQVYASQGGRISKGRNNLERFMVVNSGAPHK